MKPQQYTGKNNPAFFKPYHQFAREHDPDWVYTAFKIFMTGWLKLYRFEALGPENVPTKGPVIIVPNHFSFMDHFFVGLNAGRRVRFMAKSQLFEGPLGWMYKHGGVFPVCRGLRDEYAVETAVTLLAKQQPLVMYLQGGRGRSRNLEGETAKCGVGKIANLTGAPIVPVGVWGTQHLRDWRKGKPFPKIVVKYGQVLPGFKLPNATDEQDQQRSGEVFTRVKKLFAELDAAYGSH